MRPELPRAGQHALGLGAPRLSVLPTGVRVLSEAMPSAHSVSLGFWLPVGSRDEASNHLGATHFLEHLLFKGTATMSAAAIAESFDQVGGEANALTAKEFTCYSARLLARDMPMAVRVLSEMVTSALLDPAAFEVERGVILEELAMAADDPVDVTSEAFAKAVYGPSPLARPIGGTPETIKLQTRDGVWAHYRQHYQPSALVVTAAGLVDHDALVELVDQALSVGGWGLPDAGPASPLPRRTVLEAAGSVGVSDVVTRPVEQAHVMIGCPGLTATDPRRWVLGVAATLLGGGMSSRLFQQIREQRGLAYATYVTTDLYSDAGAFGLYAGCSPAVADQVAELMDSIWTELATDGVLDGELERAKGQISGGTILALEDPAARMNRLGVAELVTGRWLSASDLLDRIDAGTAEQGQDLVAELGARARSHITVTPA
ncbi:MAG: insulinase family protein [Micrococcales bacterium]|nr:insulinase family protein [Micrococcales bacterium]